MARLARSNRTEPLTMILGQDGTMGTTNERFDYSVCNRKVLRVGKRLSEYDRSDSNNSFALRIPCLICDQHKPRAPPFNNVAVVCAHRSIITRTILSTALTHSSCSVFC